MVHSILCCCSIILLWSYCKIGYNCCFLYHQDFSLVGFGLCNLQPISSCLHLQKAISSACQRCGCGGQREKRGFSNGGAQSEECGFGFGVCTSGRGWGLKALSAVMRKSQWEPVIGREACLLPRHHRFGRDRKPIASRSSLLVSSRTDARINPAERITMWRSHARCGVEEYVLVLNKKRRD